MVAKLALKRGMPLYVMHSGREIKEFRPTTTYNKGCLAMSVDSDHAWFYCSESVKRSISHLAVAGNASIDVTKGKLARDYETSRPPFKDWKIYNSSEPGHYVCGDLEELRHYLLQSGISPRVAYRGSVLKSMTIPSRKQHVYAEPMYAHSISAWASELAGSGYECQYRGESLATCVSQVVVALVKNKRKQDLQWRAGKDSASKRLQVPNLRRRWKQFR